MVRQIHAEYGLLVLLAINAALLAFFSGVLRKVMNDMNEVSFQRFLVSLVRHSTQSLFMIIALNLPAIAAIPYFYWFGFGNRWIVAGLLCWLVAGLFGKAYKVPLYKRVGAVASSDLARLRTERTRLNTANTLQATFYWIATALAVVAFIR